MYFYQTLCYETFQATKTAGLDNVTAILLERLGDFQGAFDLLFVKLQEAIERVFIYFFVNTFGIDIVMII